MWNFTLCIVNILALFVFTDPNIEREHAKSAENRLQMACEAFGEGMLPQLQSAVYKVPWRMLVFKILSIVVEYQSKRFSLYVSSKIQKFSIILQWSSYFVLIFTQLETKFRDPTNKTMTEREEPFRCVVKFESTNLLESLKHCASSGTCLPQPWK